MTTKVDTIFATDTSGSLNVFDLRVGTTLMHYKTENNAISPKCLNVLQDYIIAASKGPIIRAWSLNSQEKLQVRMVCPGSVGCCAVSPDERYIAVSTGQKLLIWQLASGKLLSSCSSHYQEITVIRWSQDGNDIVTGGEDGLVCVWKLSHLVSSHNLGFGIRSNDTISSHAEPRYTFSHHSVGVTDLYVGYGGLRARIFTISKDKTCRIYDLATGNQLLNIIFDVKLTAVIVDASEVRVFVGMFNGAIKSFSLLESPKTLDYHYKESETNTVLAGHTKAVSCLAFSVDDIYLISGSMDETIRLWHVDSKQLVRTISMKGAVQNVIVRLFPESLQAYELQSTTVIKSFQKRYDENEEALTLEVACPVDNYEFIPKAARTTGGEDVSALKEKLDELHRVNASLYEFAQKTLMSDKTSTSKNENKKCNENKKSKKKGK